MKNLAKQLMVRPGSHMSKLADRRIGYTSACEKDGGRRIFPKVLDRLTVLQYLLYAEGRRALLVVLQGIDAGGKDGTIRHVMRG